MMNPSQMQRMMKQLGIKTKELDCSKVVIETSSGKLIINHPQVIEMDMQGKKMYQVVGNAEEVPFNEEDVEFVMEQANVSREEAVELLSKAEGDLAKALSLKEDV